MLLRRIFSALLALCLVVCLALPASAADEQLPLEEAIIQACVYQQTLELSDSFLRTADFRALFDTLYYKGALPWYTTASYSYSYNQDNDRMVSFTPSSIYEGDFDMLAYEQQVAQILDECVLPGMTDVQIALALHDYLIVNTVYDETMEKNTGYDLIVNGTSVCAGYAEAYQDLLLRCGIDCLYVSSEEMEHGWNLVCIDGSWYHVDVTWDDPSPDIKGQVLHSNFLLTDQEISSAEEPHTGWNTDILCANTRFSDGWWREVDGQICFESSDSCYLTRSEELRNGLYRRDLQTGEEQLLFREEDQYINLGQGRYRYEHRGLALRGGKLYFNTMSAVQCIDPETGATAPEYVHGGDAYIGGFRIADDTLQLSLMDHDGNITEKSQSVTPVEQHLHAYTHTVTPPSCVSGGYTTSTCSCGVIFRTEPVAPVDHTYESVYSDEGITHTCTGCGDSYQTPLAPEEFQFSAITVPVVAVLLIVGFIFKRKGKS